MSIVLFVIGDEILSGKRRDKHVAQVIDMLAARGMALNGIEVLPDDDARISEAICRVRTQGRVLFSCGGIGATPDDRTRQAAAAAFGLPIERHPEAQALIEAQYGERAWPNRVLMADLPKGARLIPNPINHVPGFALDRAFFVPGFPEMAWPMIEWVLDGELRHLHGEHAVMERRLRVIGDDFGEGDLLPVMNQILDEFPELSLSSLPCRGDEERSRHVELGLRGESDKVGEGFERLQTLLHRLSDKLPLQFEVIGNT